MRVPETAHVKVSVPQALQALLDADPRMVPWLSSTMATIERCRAKEPGVTGSLTIALTMHQNERPTPDLGTVPTELRGIVTCAMSEFMRAERMPLFTGPEGQRSTVRISFVP